MGTSTRASVTRFFLYGLAIAGLEEFISQGVLRETYFLWVFTLIPFAVFLFIALCLRTVLYRLAGRWGRAALYYLLTGTLGLAVEWFIIGLSPWSDQTSPLPLLVIFHAGMFSFWGTVALVPHILLDERHEMIALRGRLRSVLAGLMTVTYVLAFTSKALGLPSDLQFLACIGPLIITFLTMNFFYIPYFLRDAKRLKVAIQR